MRHSKPFQIAISTLCLLVLTGTALAFGKWVYLGSRKVNHTVDHDTIPVTMVRGDFTQIRLRVRNKAIDFHRVVIHYSNGDDETAAIRGRVPAGGYTRVIDLRGHDRGIRSVEFWYDTRGLMGSHGVVTIEGWRQ